MATLQIPAPPAPRRAASSPTWRPQVAPAGPVDATTLFEAALEARIPAGSSALDVDAATLAPAPTLRRAPRPAGHHSSPAASTDWEKEAPGRWRTRLVTACASAVAVAASAGAIALAL